MKENKEFEAVVSDVDNNGTKTFEVKSEKVYKRKHIITTAIIAFLIGAIITAGGFAISKNLRGGRGDRDFRPNGIQRNIEQGDFDTNQNGSQGKMNRRGNMQNNQQSNDQNNNQNPPSMPNNAQQPNNSNASSDNNQNSEI